MITGDYSHISVILTFRYANQDRLANTIATLRFLYKNFPTINVILVEQDTFRKYDFSPYVGENFEHIFTFNAGLFNRGWGLNVGIKHSDKNHFVLTDTDMIIDPNDFFAAMHCIKAYDVVRPYNHWLWVSEKETRNFRRDPTKIDFHTTDTIEAQFAAGMLLVSREFHEKIGGFDERFEGWSPEDQVYYHKIKNMTQSILELPNTIYHLEHVRNNGETMFGHKNFARCWALRNEILNWDAAAILEYAKNTYESFGNPEKYGKTDDVIRVQAMEPQEDLAHKKFVNIVIFSKDRACQLELLLRSMKDFYPQYVNQTTTVIYRASNDEFLRAYQILIPEYPHIKFKTDSDVLSKDIIGTINEANASYIQFLTDDDVFVRPYTLDCPEFNTFANDPSISCLSLRLAPHISYGYTLKNACPTPDFIKQGVWNWRENKLTNDWYYPMSIDGNIFRTKDIYSAIKKGKYNSPNTFETALATNCPIAGDNMICFQESKVINIPCNKTQNENTNHAGLKHAYSLKYLNDMFLDGKRICTDNIYGVVNPSVHYEIPLKVKDKKK